ncbi:MAG: M23 family metallopeptidase [Nostocoides sp.]
MRDQGPRTTRRRAAVGAVSAVLAAALGLGLIAPAQGAPDPDATKKSKLDKSINATKSDLDDISAALVTANANLEQTSAQLVTAKAEVISAQAAEATAQARNREAVAALAVATGNEAKAAATLAKTTGDITKTRTQVASFAATMYQEQGASQLGIALNAASPSEFADRLEMVGTVMSVQQEAVTRLATAQAVQVAEEAHLKALQDERAAAQAEAQTALDSATAARSAAVAAQDALASLEAKQTAQATTLATRKSEESARLASMQAESSRLAAVLKQRAEAARKAAEAAARKSAAARSRSGTSSRSGSTGTSGNFLSAAELGQPITSEFGMRFHPILHIWRLHSGLDFGGPCGTPIYAAGPGTIIQAGSAGGYGNRVVIDHGIVKGVNLATTYNHLSRITRWGGKVGRGDLIGYEGTTGMSTGCHLHFETLENGSLVNPRRWL